MNTFIFLILLLFSLFGYGSSEFAYAEKQELTSLPGWDFPLPSKMYSGYLSGSNSSRLFYIYVESEDIPPSQAPITLWLNGGPGCSSLDGFWEELGPFSVNVDGSLSLRPYRWNRLSNMLFIEAPVGVGLSFSLDDNYINNDDRTAEENGNALAHFFQLFPERKTNPFFLSGESYSGIYTPTLAEVVLNRTRDGSWQGPALKGIAVGNGCTGTEIGICGMYEGNSCSGLWYEYKFLAGLSFFDNKLRSQIDTACDWPSCINAKVNSTAPSGSAAAHNYTLSSSCINLLEDAFDLLGHINVYDVMGGCDMRDYCADPANAHVPSASVGGAVAGSASLRALVDNTAAAATAAAGKDVIDTETAAVTSGRTYAGRVGDNQVDPSSGGRLGRLKSSFKKIRQQQMKNNMDPNVALEQLSRRDLVSAAAPVPGDDDTFSQEYFNMTARAAGPAECIGSYDAGVWMNQHYSALGGLKSFCWGVCNRSPKWVYNSTRTNLPRDLYPRLIGNLLVLIYNGDADSCVPYTDNEAWTENMNYTVSKAWHPWAYEDLEPSTMYSNQVGGYEVEYDVSHLANDAGVKGQGAFSFLTVRGAGHMVPQTAPAAALEMFRKFLGHPKMQLQPHYGPSPSTACDANSAATESATTTTVVLLLLLFLFMGTTACFYIKNNHLRGILEEDAQSGIYGRASSGSGSGALSPVYRTAQVDNQLDVSEREEVVEFEDVANPFRAHNRLGTDDSDGDMAIQMNRRLGQGQGQNRSRGK